MKMIKLAKAEAKDETMMKRKVSTRGMNVWFSESWTSEERSDAQEIESKKSRDGKNAA